MSRGHLGCDFLVTEPDECSMTRSPSSMLTDAAVAADMRTAAVSHVAASWKLLGRPAPDVLASASTGPCARIAISRLSSGSCSSIHLYLGRRFAGVGFTLWGYAHRLADALMAHAHRHRFNCLCHAHVFDGHPESLSGVSHLQT